MSTIDQLSTSSGLSDGDTFPVFSSSNSDTRKVSWATMVANMVAQGLVTLASVAAALGFTPVVAANKILRYTKTGLSLASSNTDVALFSGLPAKWRLRKLTIYDASTNLAASAALIGLFTGAGGTATTLVAPAVVTQLVQNTRTVDMALAGAAAADYQTVPIVYGRVTIANAGAATLTMAIEIEDLT
jgi:hypothetical protein